jgi:hypothetical protein
MIGRLLLIQEWYEEFSRSSLGRRIRKMAEKREQSYRGNKPTTRSSSGHSQEILNIR